MVRLALLLCAILAGIGLVVFLREPGPAASEGALLPDSDVPLPGADHGGLPGRTTPTSASGAGAGRGSQRELALVLRGRCREQLSGVGISGVRVRFGGSEEGEEGEVEVVSDEHGRFELTPAPPLLDVLVTAPAGWWTVMHGPVDDEYRVQLAPDDIGPLHARLRDAQTKEAIPDYTVRVVDSHDWAETVSSDAEGILRTEALLTRGPLVLRGAPEEVGDYMIGMALATHQHEPAGSEPPLASIAISVGPTFRIALENPGAVPLKRLRASLLPRAWMSDSVDDPALGSPLRPGKLPWVRLSTTWSWMEDPQLVVTDTGGRWLGHASVESSSGVDQAPVPIRLERTVRVRGRVLDADGERVAKAQVQLSLADAPPLSMPRMTDSNGLGIFIIDGVPPGTYDLVARHNTAGACSVRVSVHPSDEERRDYHLEPFDVAGDIAGVVTSLSGGYHGRMMLLLSPMEDKDDKIPNRSIRVPWTREGTGYVGHFRFASVPKGRFSLRASTFGDSFRVTPGHQTVEAPLQALTLLVEDDAERFLLRIRVVDKLSGDWLVDARLRVTDSAGTVLYDDKAVEWSPAERYGEDEQILWEVSAQGYVSERGGRGAFDRRYGSRSRQALIQLMPD